MLIRPLSTLTAADFAGDFAPTQANFPNLKHYFPCTDASTPEWGTLVDSIAGVQVYNQQDTILTNTGDGFITFGGVFAAIGTTDDAWQVPGTKTVVIFFVGKPANNTSFRWGNVGPSFYGVRLVAGASNFTAANAGGTRVDGTAQPAGTGALAVYAVAVTPGNVPGTSTGIRGFSFDGTTLTASTPTGNLSGWSSGFTAVTTSAQMNVNPIHSFGVHFFTTFPTDIPAAIVWLYNRAVSNPTDKLVYPGWRGVD